MIVPAGGLGGDFFILKNTVRARRFFLLFH